MSIRLELKNYQTNTHKCICCYKLMKCSRSNQVSFLTSRLLCVDCYRAYIRYCRGKRLQLNENLILRCVSMRVNQ